MSRDMMPNFELYQPALIENALDLAKRLGPQSWLLAGGNDSLDWFKDRAKRPPAVIDIGGIASLKGVRETPDGIEIGALTTLTEIERHPLIQSQYGVLASAARHVASPQIRNSGTLGGNLCQDARCWYYRSGLNCYRAGGNTCYADTPQGQNREHCLYGASRCVAVSPSDTATAAVALDAKMVIRGPSAERVVAAEDFFIGPAKNITRMTVLAPGEILTAVRLPKAWANAKFYFEKVADRRTFDFALVSIAAVMIVEGGVIKNVRLACGGVECVPRRLKVVEQVVTGSAPSAATASLAGKTAVQGATPLNFNHFKIPLLENLVRRAIRDA
jgi:xanthine dehydrogenase YagS FAD-binding subunit